MSEDETLLAVKMAERILEEGLDVSGHLSVRATESQSPNIPQVAEYRANDPQNAEHISFRKMREHELVLRKSTKKQQPPTTEETPVVAALIEAGVTTKTAQTLAGSYPADQIRTQLTYHPYRKGLAEPAAALVQAIKENRAPPQAFLDAQAKALKAQDQEEKLAVREKAKQDAAARADRLENVFGTLSSNDQQSLQDEAERQARKLLGNQKLSLPRMLVRAKLYDLLETKYGTPASSSDA